MKNIVVFRIFRFITDDKISCCQQVTIFSWNFVTMRLKATNLKSENFKYVALAKKNSFKKNQQGG